MVERVDYSEESTERKLEIARRRRDEAAAEVDLAKAKHGDWNEYAEALEAIQALEERLGMKPMAKPEAASPQHRDAGVTLVNSLLAYGYQMPTGEVVHSAAFDWLQERDVAMTKQGVNSTLAHRKDLFRRVGRGRYVLTPAGRSRASELVRGPLGTRLSVVRVGAVVREPVIEKPPAPGESFFERRVEAYQTAAGLGS